MKLLLLALIVTFTATFSPDNSRWLQDIPPLNEETLIEEETSLNLLPEISLDPLLLDIFSFGIDTVISTGISRGKIPNTDFHAVSVSDYYETNEIVETGTIRYTFTAVAESDDGNAVVDTTFNVRYDVNTREKRIGAYTSKTTTTTIITRPETPVTPETPEIPPVVIETPEPTEEETVIIEIDEEAAVGVVNLLPEITADPLLTEIFDFGITNVIASGISRGRIPNTSFRAVSVSDWSRRQDSYGEWNTFSAVAVSDDGASVVETTFTVYYDYSSQQKTLNSYTTTTTTTTVTTTTPGEEEVFMGEDNEVTL